jgi:hypothetical protein
VTGQYQKKVVVDPSLFVANKGVKINRDYDVKSTDFEVLVDASCRYPWWERFYAFLTREPLPQHEVTITLPAPTGCGQIVFIRKVDNSNNPVVVRPGGGDVSQFLITKEQVHQLMLDVRIGKTSNVWEFAEGDEQVGKSF